jgi:hypothetical protein
MDIVANYLKHLHFLEGSGLGEWKRIWVSAAASAIVLVETNARRKIYKELWAEPY